MKKVLVFAVALMMAMSVYAVSTAGIGTLTSFDKAEVPVTFDLTSGVGSWEIGFASDVSQFEADGTVEPLDKIELTHNKTTNIGESAANGVYVYWKLTGDQRVKISLAADGAMQSVNLASGGDTAKYDYLNWQTSWSENASATDGSVSSGSLGGDAVHTDTDNPVAETAYTTAQMIYTRTNTTQSEVKGSAALTIVTQNVATAAPSSYTGHLTLKIEPIGD